MVPNRWIAKVAIALSHSVCVMISVPGSQDAAPYASFTYGASHANPVHAQLDGHADCVVNVLHAAASQVAPVQKQPGAAHAADVVNVLHAALQTPLRHTHPVSQLALLVHVAF
jgi:hypothetical protein